MVPVQLGVVNSVTMLRWELGVLVGLEVAAPHQDTLDAGLWTPNHFRENGGRSDDAGDGDQETPEIHAPPPLVGEQCIGKLHLIPEWHKE